MDLTVAPDARPPGYLFARRGAALRGARDGAASEFLALDPAQATSRPITEVVVTIKRVALAM